MAIQRTTWRPDTCGCIATYEWDDAVPDDQRVHTPVQLQPCADHTRLHANNVLRWQAMENENKGKNAIWRKAIERIPSLEQRVQNPLTGREEITQDLDQFEWTFDENRQLSYNIKNATPKQLADIEGDLALDADASKINKQRASSLIIQSVKTRMQQRLGG